MSDESPLNKDITIHKEPSGRLRINEFHGYMDDRAKRTVILPFLVNGHTHFELSYFKNRFAGGREFVPWLKDLQKIKKELKSAEIQKSTQMALNDSWDFGTGIVIDICNDLSIWHDLKIKDERQQIFVYHELIGFDPDFANQLVDSGKSDLAKLKDEQPLIFSELTPHSAYASSHELMRKIKENAQYNQSLHLAEHNAEMSMLGNKSGAMVDYMKEIGVWSDNWTPGNSSFIEELLDKNFLQRGDIAVHLVKISDKEIGLIAENGVIPCLCPRSNDFYNNGQPPVNELLNQGLKPLLGTDSLASNSSLNMIDEVRFALIEWPGVPPIEVFKMATTNIKQFLPFSDPSNFFPLRDDSIMPFIEIVFAHPVDDPFESFKTDTIVEQNIHD